MKKKILAISAVLGIAALVLSMGTLAYFTDTEKATNTFTIGNVDIALYESQIHRVNANVSANVTDGVATASSENSHVCLNGNIYCTPGIAVSTDLSDVSAWQNNHVRAQNVAGVSGAGQFGVFSDTQIISDSTNDYSTYTADEYKNLVPGKSVRKFVYVKNTGNSSAYVRIRVTVPAAYKDIIEVRIPHTPQETTTATGNVYMNGEDATGAYFTQTTTTADSGDLVYEFTANKPLKADEMTYWSPISTVKIKDTVTQAQLSTAQITQFTVDVEADAIQAEGFADAATAFAAFDAQS